MKSDITLKYHGTYNKIFHLYHSKSSVSENLPDIRFYRTQSYNIIRNIYTIKRYLSSRTKTLITMCRRRRTKFA